MKALVILNPAAGKDAGEAVHEALIRHAGGSNVGFEIHELLEGEKPGDIVRTRLRNGFDLVVAAGGDGTVSAVFDGLLGTSVPLGIIPTGTGNLIAREFGIPTDVDDAVALIVGTPLSMKIDAIKIGMRVYVLSSGVGISAAVIGGTTPANKGRFGRLAYFATALRIFRFRPRTLAVTVDDKKREYRAVEVAISNCGILARTLYPKGPDIRPDDGHLDIWILSLKTFRDYVRYFVGIIVGRRANLKAQFLTAEEHVSVTSRVSLATQADGDIIGTTPLEIEVLPNALTVLAPKAPPASS